MSSMAYPATQPKPSRTAGMKIAALVGLLMLTIVIAGAVGLTQPQPPPTCSNGASNPPQCDYQQKGSITVMAQVSNGTPISFSLGQAGCGGELLQVYTSHVAFSMPVLCSLVNTDYSIVYQTMTDPNQGPYGPNLTCYGSVSRMLLAVSAETGGNTPVPLQCE